MNSQFRAAYQVEDWASVAINAFPLLPTSSIRRYRDAVSRIRAVTPRGHVGILTTHGGEAVLVPTTAEPGGRAARFREGTEIGAVGLDAASVVGRDSGLSGLDLTGGSRKRQCHTPCEEQKSGEHLQWGLA